MRGWLFIAVIAAAAPAAAQYKGAAPADRLLAEDNPFKYLSFDGASPVLYDPAGLSGWGAGGAVKAAGTKVESKRQVRRLAVRGAFAEYLARNPGFALKRQASDAALLLDEETRGQVRLIWREEIRHLDAASVVVLQKFERAAGGGWVFAEELRAGPSSF